MKLSALLTAMTLAASVFPVDAAPVLLLRGANGVDLANLTVGVTFEVEAVVDGDTPNEFDAGGSGGGGFSSNGSPFVSVLSVSLGTLAQGIDWSLDPTLFIFQFEATSVGSGVLGTQDQCLNSTLQNYGCGFSSGPLSFTVRSTPAGVPEPSSILLAGLALWALTQTARRRSV